MDGGGSSGLVMTVLDDLVKVLRDAPVFNPEVQYGTPQNLDS